MIKLGKGKIAVDPIFDSDRSPSGLLIIPDEAKERCDQGIVKYVGSKVEGIQIGDYVLFSGYTGTTVRLDGEGILIIMHAEFVICKVEAPNTEIPGLYFKDNEGIYWTATHEMATSFMSRAMEDILQHKQLGKTPITRG